MKWNQASEDMLVRLSRKGWTAERVASKLGCTPDEVKVTLERVKATPPPPAPAPEGIPVTNLQEAQQLEAYMDHVQKAFVAATHHYNHLGEKFKVFANLVSFSLQKEELATLIQQCFGETREQGETAAQKLARVLLKHCVVMVRPKEDPNGKGG